MLVETRLFTGQVHPDFILHQSSDTEGTQKQI